MMRIPEVNEAREIVIELGERGGDLENLKRAAYRVVGGHEAFLSTAARRLKYEYLLWRIVDKDDVGQAPGEVIYGCRKGVGYTLQNSTNKTRGRGSNYPKNRSYG